MYREAVKQHNKHNTQTQTSSTSIKHAGTQAGRQEPHQVVHGGRGRALGAAARGGEAGGAGCAQAAVGAASAAKASRRVAESEHIHGRDMHKNNARE